MKKRNRYPKYKFAIGTRVQALGKHNGEVIARFDPRAEGGSYVVKLDREFTTTVHSMGIYRAVFHASVLQAL